jgi:aspartate/methionine/tyrosine aminotransferase
VFAPIRYLDFAIHWYGQVSYDLATSGVAEVDAATLGEAPPNDLGARHRFREALAARYRVPVAEVVTALGASGALFVAYATLLEPGAHLLVESPSYEPLWRNAEALGVGIDRFERRFDAAFRLDPDAVVSALRPETRLVAITNPHNPSGMLASEAELGALASALDAHGVRLLVDEAYLELLRPKTTARRSGDNVITCASATKCLGVGFARAGWLLMPAALAEDASRIEQYVSGHAPPISWAWGERAVARADRLLSRAHSLQQGKRIAVDRFVAGAEGTLSWNPPPDGGVFGWLVDERGHDTLPAIERGIQELGVIAAPGVFFGEPSALRLGWTAASDKIEEGLRRLARALGIPAAELAMGKGRS